MKNLVIVESPAKAKTIERFLGEDFVVTSSYGHIRDLKKSNDAIDTDNNFHTEYIVPDDKKKVVSELKKLTKKAQEVWLATDEDREGEAISWHLSEVLGLDIDKVKRIVFHEITKPAIQAAIQSPRLILKDLVDAQQARRVLDRLVGFELSPILWRKVKTNLSAGRVQSVAVRLIVEREREIDAFNPKASFKVLAYLITQENGKDKLFRAELKSNIASEEDARAFLEKCNGADFTVSNVQVKPAKKSPAAPFTTSTLQQEASRKMGFSVSKTMMVAQRLYESGKITYMRTDSVNLSDTAIKAAAAAIASKFGDNYVQTRQFKTKSSGAQEAHEAIRPTYLDRQQEGDDNDQQRLYDLIWKRTLASQMSDAQLERTVAKISISGLEEELTANGEVIKFDGFLKLYIESTDDEQEDEDNDLLPALVKGQSLVLKQLTATERFSRPPARFTEASLVKKLEELGIGRPSTYAPTISTVQKRGYVEKAIKEGVERKYHYMQLEGGTISEEKKTEITGAEKNKLSPTDIGKLVNDFLLDNFKKVMDYGFTAQIENEFDQIASGQKNWTKMLESFYRPFHANVEETLETAERVTGERELGTDPKTGKTIIARMGRYGPMVQLGNQDDEEKPTYAKLRPGMSLETVTLEDALELFKLPRKLGEYEGKQISTSVGRFGPYVLHNNQFASIKGKYDPLDISYEQAIEVIEEKKKADAAKHIKSFEGQEIEILNGRWGPYIKADKLNVRLPKDIEKPEELTLEEVKKIIEEAAKKPKKGKAKVKRKVDKKK